ncbi:hypothetical protein BD31_I2010 [Candidatus Nitrosopumilus salaria BD31]|uniref:Uncharacterized protein n=1 Tax=Candidatus Nitrosopumilus salarius BD31 TaxID=859350 RepID=I3D1S8_9ARCH|nr:hypothetical protein [Candidatus Nitrosopumilus salaria]EIJ65671.1 hypothetical protein BD31_I2010 [Candidatus Nitrosopumilus salaria BD31]
MEKKNFNKVAKCVKSELVTTTLHAKDNLNQFVKDNQKQIDFIKKQYEEYFAELIDTFETRLKYSHKIEYTMGKMESLKPLFDLVDGKFDPIPSIHQIIIVLDKAYVGIKGTEFDKHFISSDMKRLRENLLKIISHA